MKAELDESRYKMKAYLIRYNCENSPEDHFFQHHTDKITLLQFAEIIHWWMLAAIIIVLVTRHEAWPGMNAVQY
jgi:hypothetical protein